MAAKRKYPVGIQSFESIRLDGYMYVDKTPLIYKMITEGKPYFLSRPRRFGKSLLISTLQAVFEGRRELFEAFTTEYGIEQPQLYIATTDWKWEKFPVLRFDFSAGDLSTIEQLDTLIDETLKNYERKYGITPDVKDANVRMVNLMRTLHEQTGKRVVVLCDEYDNFILHSLGDDEKVVQARQRFQNVFGPLKAEDDHLQFALITGISKFSQMGIFSKLKNLKNISMRDDYAAICGISEEELTTQLHQDIELMAERNGLYRAWSQFQRNYDLDAFIESFKGFFASMPYQWAQDNNNEHYYHALLYTLLTSFGADIRAEEPTAKGQADLTLVMPKGIYVMEIKYGHTADEALAQIDRKGYAEKYRLDGRPVTKIGISFSSEERNITGWKAVPL